ncbi:MAG: hypothetical protein AT718_07445 [Vulcanisaeta sp. JCHS_4]|jgi:hypothetical protein|nr:MAG: hypothetical protein AT718_07445 [Vulcanisaeta sp. JCHS_4]
MKIAIFTHVDSLSGSNYRVVNVLRFFPRDKYVLLMPRNRKYAFIDVLTRFGGNPDALLSIINNAYELRVILVKMFHATLNTAITWRK